MLEVARGGLLRAGMGVPFVDVGAVLNVQSDHLGLKGIDTLEQLAEVKRIVVEVARDCAVLNADDENTIRMSAHTEAKHLCYVTLNPQHAVVREHVRAGGRACALEAGVNGQMITLYDKGRHIPLMWTHLIPATLEGRAMHNVQNAMFAAALAFSLDIKLDAIRQGLRTFDTTFFQAPGRMNVYDEHPFKVIFDYAHNAHAVRRHGRPRLPARRARPAHRGRSPGPATGATRTSAPSPRRSPAASTTTSAAATTGCAAATRTRCRKCSPQTLRAHGVPETAIEIIPDEQAAVDAALRLGQPGDLLLDLRRCAHPLVETDHQVQARDRHGRPRRKDGCRRGDRQRRHQPRGRCQLQWRYRGGRRAGAAGGQRHAAAGTPRPRLPRGPRLRARRARPALRRRNGRLTRP